MEQQTPPRDLTDLEWSVIGTPITGLLQTRQTASVLKAVRAPRDLYRVRSGKTRWMAPQDLPPWRICYHYFSKWKKEGVWQRVQDELLGYARHRS